MPQCPQCRYALLDPWPVYVIDVMGKAQGERLPFRVLSAVPALDQELRDSGPENITVSTHIIRKPAVLVPDSGEVFFFSRVEVPEFRLLLNGPYHGNSHGSRVFQRHSVSPQRSTPSIIPPEYKKLPADRPDQWRRLSSGSQERLEAVNGSPMRWDASGHGHNDICVPVASWQS